MINDAGRASMDFALSSLGNSSAGKKKLLIEGLPKYFQ